MRTKLIALATFIFSAFTSAQVLAHHSFAAEFDSNSPINIQGVVVKVEWTNPHTYFYVEVETEDGDYEEWAMEMGSPNGLMRRGWTRDTLEIGTEVIVRGTRARDGSTKGNVQSVVLAETCQRLFAGTSQRNFVEDEAPTEGCE
ncbi:DUF6152 family protein [Gammaproteobacteria bacterium]|nr:DUF6152 family protein [Gammaproteobacteria bacterium]